MANSGDINVGTVIRFNGELCQLVEYQHRTPGNLRAFYQGKNAQPQKPASLQNTVFAQVKM
jgi:elongation factor P